MLRRDIADRLQVLLCNRIRKEQPDRELTKEDIEKMWQVIYGKLNKGEPEEAVETWCLTVPFENAVLAAQVARY